MDEAATSCSQPTPPNPLKGGLSVEPAGECDEFVGVVHFFG
jgi:hypothetical protein